MVYLFFCTVYVSSLPPYYIHCILVLIRSIDNCHHIPFDDNSGCPDSFVSLEIDVKTVVASENSLRIILFYVLLVKLKGSPLWARNLFQIVRWMTKFSELSSYGFFFHIVNEIRFSDELFDLLHIYLYRWKALFNSAYRQEIHFLETKRFLSDNQAITFVI